MWATAEESWDEIVGLYREVWAHSDATIDALALEAPGRVLHWPSSRSDVTLHRILVHVIAKDPPARRTCRHRPESYRARLEVARSAG